MATVRAKIRLLRTEEGGRLSGATSGYRPIVRVGDLHASGSIELLDRELIEPGDECEVNITILYRKYVEDHLTLGTTFDLTEGARKVGEGKVLAVLGE